MPDMIDKVREAVAEAAEETGFDPDAVTPAAEAEQARNADGTFAKAEGTDAAGDAGAAGDDKEKEEEPTAAEPEKPKTKGDDKEEEEDFDLTAEEVDAIREDPKLLKMYKSLQRNYTKKSEAVSAKLKEAETALNVVDAIKKDPVTNIKEMAKAAGLEILEKEKKEPEKPVKKPLAERIVDMMKGKVGEEAASVLGPMFVEAAQEISSELQAPINEKLTKQEQREQEREKEEANRAFHHAVLEFGNKVIAEGGDWDEEIEKEMTVLTGKVLPGNDVSLPEYLDMLHTKVMADRQKKDQKGRELDRLRRAARATEPTKPTKPAPAAVQAITPGMGNKQAAALAVEQARRELGVS